MPARLAFHGEPLDAARRGATLRSMKIYWLCLLALPACGGGSSIGGSYNGTLTVDETGAQVVAATTANVLTDEDSVEIFSNDDTNVSCTIEGIDRHGSDIVFRCNELTCSCSIGSANLEVTTASGAITGDQLSLTFSGTDTNNAAFSATFAGTLEAGTR
jgi:hypothetical protein